MDMHDIWNVTLTLQYDTIYSSDFKRFETLLKHYYVTADFKRFVTFWKRLSSDSVSNWIKSKNAKTSLCKYAEIHRMIINAFVLNIDTELVNQNIKRKKPAFFQVNL